MSPKLLTALGCGLIGFALSITIPTSIPKSGFEQNNPAATQFFGYIPSTLAAGELPLHAMVHFQNPLDTFQGGSYNVRLNIGLGALEAAVPALNDVAPNWVPFVPFLFKWGQYAHSEYIATQRKFGIMPQLAPMNLGNAYDYGCHVDSGTDPSGKLLISAITGESAGDAACTYPSGTWLTLWIPQRFLNPNPDWPDARITMQMDLNSREWDDNFASSQHTLSPLAGAVSWTVTAPEVELSSLQFQKFVPSSTIQGVQLTSIKVTFALGVNVLAGGQIAFLALAPIFQDVPVTIGNTLTPIVIGYGNCFAEPTRQYCCHSSYGYTRVSNGIFGYDSSESSNELLTGGWSVLSIVLGPAGCMLPADKVVTFTIPQAYLGSNPSLIAADSLYPYNYAFRTVNVRMSTSSEPQPTQLMRYTQSGDSPFYTAQIQSYTDISSKDDGHPFAVWQYGANPFNTYIIGTQTVSFFSAVLDTLTTNVIPSFIKISFTLNTDFVFPEWGTPPDMPFTPQRIVITADQGVFRPNQGTIELPLAVGNGGFVPSACSGAVYFTNSWSTLVVSPNPTWSESCNSALTANTVVSFTLPGSVLLPNPAAGTVVTFDIRIVPWYSVPFYNNDDINEAGLAQADTVDGATLMDQYGYTIVAVCGSQTLAIGTFNSVASLSVRDRCNLVASISTLSPISAAILQCQLNGGYTTFVKYPEGVWTQNHWPLTNVAALGNWAQIVSWQANAPAMFITGYGHMISHPMFAIIVTYPPTTQSLQVLGINPSVPAGWSVAFIIQMDRMTLSCASANNFNPWMFAVQTPLNIVEVMLVVDYLAVGTTGTPLREVQGSQWAQRDGMVLVTAAHGGVVYGYSAILVSPIPDDGSDDALFGLLALIAVPVLLCCCLLALLWFLRPKAEPCPCVPEYPVQEMYWVNAQPAAPVYMMESAAQCMAAPPVTPIYLVQ